MGDEGSVQVGLQGVWWMWQGGLEKKQINSQRKQKTAADNPMQKIKPRKHGPAAESYLSWKEKGKTACAAHERRKPKPV